ncbi:hypothetical protein BpHYR1_035825, partial [Brachionus plicatilis]
MSRLKNKSDNKAPKSPNESMYLRNIAESVKFRDPRLLKKMNVNHDSEFLPNDESEKENIPTNAQNKAKSRHSSDLCKNMAKTDEKRNEKSKKATFSKSFDRNKSINNENSLNLVSGQPQSVRKISKPSNPENQDSEKSCSQINKRKNSLILEEFNKSMVDENYDSNSKKQKNSHDSDIEEIDDLIVIENTDFKTQNIKDLKLDSFSNSNGFNIGYQEIYPKKKFKNNSTQFNSTVIHSQLPIRPVEFFQQPPQFNALNQMNPYCPSYFYNPFYQQQMHPLMNGRIFTFNFFNSGDSFVRNQPHMSTFFPFPTFESS